MATTNAAETNVGRMRWGGICLAIGALLVAIDIGLYIGVVEAGAPADTATNAELAAFYAGQGAELQMAGWIGVYADILVATAAFFLVTRVLNTRSTTPGSASWILVAIGNLIFVASDAFNATALATIAGAYGTTPALFDAGFALNEAAFGIGMLLVGLGICGVFWGEARATNAAIPAIACYIGFAGGVCAVVGAFGPILGVPALLYVSVGMFASLLLFVWLGARIGFPNLPLGRREPTAKPERA